MANGITTIRTLGIVKLPVSGPVEPPVDPSDVVSVVETAASDAGGGLVFDLSQLALTEISGVLVELTPEIENLEVIVQSVTPQEVTALVRPVAGLVGAALLTATGLVAGVVATLTAIGRAAL